MESDKAIYLDYAATTPIDPEVMRTMLEYFHPRYGNPSSLYARGRRAAEVIKQARSDVAGVLNASPEEIIFTGSGTESDNLALLGTARANRARGNHILISSVEHKAILQAGRQLQREGFAVSLMPVDEYGRINIGECLNLVRADTILISVMYANNEIGTVEPIQELSRALKKYRKDTSFPLFHTDACQAPGFLPLDVHDLGVDLMTMNGSKIYGPKGVGVLYKKRGIRIDPLIVGGEQEMNLRAGTESLPLIVGFTEALKKVNDRRMTESKRLIKLRNRLIRGLRERIPAAILNGHPIYRLPNNVHISIPHVEGESLLLMLDRLGIEASTGSACSAHDLKPSHVLLAIGQNAEFAHGSIRFSLGKDTTRREIETVLSVFPPIVERLKEISALTMHPTPTCI